MHQKIVMEPKYYAFWRWLDIPIISWEYDDWCLYRDYGAEKSQNSNSKKSSSWSPNMKSWNTLTGTSFPQRCHGSKKQRSGRENKMDLDALLSRLPFWDGMLFAVRLLGWWYRDVFFQNSWPPYMIIGTIGLDAAKLSRFKLHTEV